MEEYVYSVQKIETVILCEKCKLEFKSSHEWRVHDRYVHDVKYECSGAVKTKGLNMYGRKLK